ncbi:hypothetical protein JOC36_001520 [Weissella uvarum]|uniref:hypothetical protein n=1 Tax=Weissella uvarum TaxID=1479233 RepID=UPI00195FF016|nr:hypothetical protein [Weissella uvarum]MBM7617927.1 hypothetical protein [Weissella uvarum]MCM0596077.1 hypothetical protein [Weissella uvarum]
MTALSIIFGNDALVHQKVDSYTKFLQVHIHHDEYVSLYAVEKEVQTILQR